MTLNEIIEGDALTVLKTLPDKIVQTCITSPPYWGLRDYKIEGQLGLEKTPEEYVTKMVEVFHELRRVLRDDGTLWLNMGDSYAGSGRGRDADGTWNPGQGGSKQATNVGSTIGRLVNSKSLSKNLIEKGAIGNAWVKPPRGYKAKDLCGIPWRVAFALQGFAVVPYQSFYTWANQLKMAREARDWEAVKIVEDHLRFYGMIYEMLGNTFWLRSDIIWNKPNPMPESCTDRPTRSHEYIFLLTKSGTSQYWTHRDLNGTRKRPKADWRWVNQVDETEIDYPPDDWKKIVPCPICDATGKVMIWDGMLEWPDECPVCKGERETQLWKRINLWQGHDYVYDADAVREPAQNRISGSREMAYAEQGLVHKEWKSEWGRNLRTVWTFATQPFPEAHFATFPEELVRRCILAGTAEQACPICRAAWERVLSDIKTEARGYQHHENPLTEGNRMTGIPQRGYEPAKTLGFRATCDCENNDGSGRCIALDPFMGSGTVAYVALKLGRDYIGMELKPEYIKMIEKRLKPLGNRPCPQQVEAL